MLLKSFLLFSYSTDSPCKKQSASEGLPCRGKPGKGLFAREALLSDLTGLLEKQSLEIEKKELTEEEAEAYASQVLQNLQSLNLSENQVSDIGALEDLTGLTKLNLSSNQIKDISVLKKLKNLTILNLFSNELQDISALKGLSRLERLILSYNEIEDLSPLQENMPFTVNLLKKQVSGPKILH